MTDEIVEKCKIYIGLLDNGELLEVAKEAVKKLSGSGKDSIKKML